MNECEQPRQKRKYTKQKDKEKETAAVDLKRSKSTSAYSTSLLIGVAEVRGVGSGALRLTDSFSPPPSCSSGVSSSSPLSSASSSSILTPYSSNNLNAPNHVNNGSNEIIHSDISRYNHENYRNLKFH